MRREKGKSRMKVPDRRETRITGNGNAKRKWGEKQR
jgi:hypothetical protein